MANTTANYGNDSIRQLKDEERVRLRPAVIFGSDGLDGCAHAAFEILSNSVDEARQGYGDLITLTAFADGSIQVFDTSTFTVGGEPVTSAFALDTDGDFTADSEEAVFDGAFHESYFQSAPYFTLQIDGIEWLNSAFG